MTDEAQPTNGPRLAAGGADDTAAPTDPPANPISTTSDPAYTEDAPGLIAAPTSDPLDLPSMPPIQQGLQRRRPKTVNRDLGNDLLAVDEDDSLYHAPFVLTADDLITGNAADRAHLDDVIVQVRDWVQEALASANMADRVTASRHDKALRNTVSGYIDRLAVRYMNRENIVSGPERPYVTASVINEIVGLGPIEPLWSDPTITEVMVNGPDTVYVERGGKVIRAKGCRFRDKNHLLDVCQQILLPLNRRVDQRNPLEDGRLPDGSRVNVVHYAVSPTGPQLTIRRFPETVWTLKALVENGSLTESMACELAFLIAHKASVLVVGGTGAGKTSLLNALSTAIPRDERVVTVEDSLELRFHPSAHVLALEGRPAAASGEGEVTIRRLVKNALRMRPDRIVVGEVRDAAALDMLQACNTGHEGSMTTVHANGSDEAIARLGVLVAQGGEIPEDKVQWLIGDAIDIIVYQRRFEDGSRRVQSISEVPSMRASGERSGPLRPIPLWEWQQTGEDADGKYVGDYIKLADITEELRRKKRLDMFRRITMNDIEEMSALEDAILPS